MQDAADEITLRDEEGALRADFLHAVEAALRPATTPQSKLGPKENEAEPPPLQLQPTEKRGASIGHGQQDGNAESCILRVRGLSHYGELLTALSLNGTLSMIQSILS